MGDRYRCIGHGPWPGAGNVIVPSSAQGPPPCGWSGTLDPATIHDLRCPVCSGDITPTFERRLIGYRTSDGRVYPPEDVELVYEADP